MTANQKQIGGSHYKTGGLELWDLSSMLLMHVLTHGAIKYVSRYPMKNGRQDLEKAIHYWEKYCEVYDTDPKLKPFYRNSYGGKSAKDLVKCYLESGDYSPDQVLAIWGIVNAKNRHTLGATMTQLKGMLKRVSG